MPSDSSDQASIDRVFAALDERFGRLDVLLNAAGINPMQGRPEDFPMEVWALVIDVNLTGYLRFAKAAGQRMIDGGRGGSIINISSISGTSALGRGNLAYGVSKAGVDQMTRELAVDWAWRGIRVNSIQPCQFLNDGLRALIADPARAHLADHMIAGIPIGRMGRSDEIVGPDPVPRLGRRVDGHRSEPAGGWREPGAQRRRHLAEGLTTSTTNLSDRASRRRCSREYVHDRSPGARPPRRRHRAVHPSGRPRLPLSARPRS